MRGIWIITLSCVFWGVDLFAIENQASKFSLSPNNYLLAEETPVEHMELAAKKKKKKKSAEGEAAATAAPSIGWYFVPLGAGQFMNGSPILGGVFLVAQLAGFVMGFSQYSAANDAYTTGQKYADDNANNPPADYNATIQKYQKTQDEAAASSTMFFAIAGIAYGASVVEAFVSAPTGEAVDQPGGKKKKKKKKKDEGETTTTDLDKSWQIQQDFAQVTTNPQMFIRFNPLVSNSGQSLRFDLGYRF